MTVNNLDTSSSGINIQIKLERDDDLSRSMFDNNFSKLSTDVWQYVDEGNIEKLSTEDMITIASSNSKEDLRDATEEFSSSQGYFHDDNTKKELLDALRNTEMSDLYPYHGESVSDMLTVTEKFEMFTVTGYSQGDSAKVLVPHILGKVWGRSPKEEEILNDLKSEVHHLFYDSPITGNITIDGEEYEIREYLDDPYEWNKEAVIDSLKRHRELSPLVFQQLEAILPEDDTNFRSQSECSIHVVEVDSLSHSNPGMEDGDEEYTSPAP